MSLGHSLRKDTFILREEITSFNHGSFGTVPKPVMDAHVRLLMEQESCPELWFRETYFTHIENSRKCISELINANIEDVVLVENASSAVNAILRSFPFKEGDKVLCLSSAYKMVLDTLLFLEKILHIATVLVDIPYPLRSTDEIIIAVEETLQKEDTVRMCIFSHISSMPTIIEPVKELTKIAKQHGAVVIIDGAHAPGVIQIDVQAVGADYYLGNCHKWLFASKGSAFLWTSHNHQNLLCPQPVVISSSGKYEYVDRFAYTGTRDYVALCVIPAGLAFINNHLGGLDNMRKYCRDLLKRGCDLLVNRWQTSYLVPFAADAFMTNVILPCTNEQEVKHLHNNLWKEYHIITVYGSVPRRLEDGGGMIYFLRISAQVYLEYADFEMLAEKVLQILQNA